MNYIPKIHDVKNTNFTDSEQEILIDFFESAMKRVSISIIKRADFDLKDFDGMIDMRASTATLQIERRIVNEKKQWFGIFSDSTDESKKLEILGTLVED